MLRPTSGHEGVGRHWSFVTGRHSSLVPGELTRGAQDAVPLQGSQVDRTSD